MDNKVLGRTLIAGGVLAVVGIGLFILLWTILGNMPVSSFARLMLSLCIPPILMAAGLGAFFLLVRPASKDE